ncbi:MAG: 50S ribosomal protein L11 methyltransferase [Alphaproteobacteria bacterium]
MSAMSDAPLWRVHLDVPVANAEIFGAVLEDEALALTVMQPPRQDRARIEAIFAIQPDQGTLNARLAIIAAVHGVDAPACVIESVPPQDWLRLVAQASPPRRIGRLVVYGTHDAGKIPPYIPSLHIDAATAFGTGEHPSTHMCLLLLQEWLRRRRPRRILDIGCGSGILALAAARLAHSQALAIDCDPESVRMTRNNVRQNGVESYIRVIRGDGYRAGIVRQRRPYDLIFANIFARPLVQMADDLQRHLAPGGVAILAGLLRSQAAMVQSAHRMQRLHLLRRIHMGEWAALLLVRKRER